MRGTIRGAAVVLGAEMAVYGAASLTGAWLGTPPWWEREPTEAEAWDGLARWAVEVGTRRDGAPAGPSLLGATLPATGSGDAVPPPPRLRVPRDGRTAISAAVTAASLALVVVGGAAATSRGSGAVNRGSRVGFAVLAAALMGGRDLLAGLLIVSGVAYILFTTGPDLTARRRRLPTR